MKECLICGTKFEPKDLDHKLCGGSHCEVGFASQSNKGSLSGNGAPGTSQYLQPISYFLKGLWIFLNGAIVILVTSIVSDWFTAPYLSCVEEAERYGYFSSRCTNFSPVVGLIGVLVSAFVFYFAGRAGRFAISRLNEIDSK